MYFIPEEKIFPPVHLANNQGLLGIGGDLSTERLEVAYKKGIFPWFAKEDEILWWAPDPRMILFPSEIKISKSMRQLIRKEIYLVTEDREFKKVINQCAYTGKRGGKESWLHEKMIDAYIALYKNGLAHSLEVWNKKGQLVGGLYYVQVLPNIISGESMFHLESNTSKLAFIHLAQKAQKEKLDLIDCQFYTPHLASLGAKEIPREIYMNYLNNQ